MGALLALNTAYPGDHFGTAQRRARKRSVEGTNSWMQKRVQMQVLQHAASQKTTERSAVARAEARGTWSHGEEEAGRSKLIPFGFLPRLARALSFISVQERRG